jgi:hypothetical protein
VIDLVIVVWVFLLILVVVTLFAGVKTVRRVRYGRSSASAPTRACCSRA